MSLFTFSIVIFWYLPREKICTVIILSWLEIMALKNLMSYVIRIYLASEIHIYFHDFKKCHGIYTHEFIKLCETQINIF